MANSTVKVTRVDAMNICKGLVAGTDRADKDEVMAVIDKLIESFSKKSVSKADKERMAENENIRTAILDALADGKKLRVSDLTKAVNDSLETDYTSNKVSAQVTVLKNDGNIVREVDKKVAYFTLA